MFGLKLDKYEWFSPTWICHSCSGRQLQVGENVSFKIKYVFAYLWIRQILPSWLWNKPMTLFIVGWNQVIFCLPMCVFVYYKNEIQMRWWSRSSRWQRSCSCQITGSYVDIIWMTCTWGRATSIGESFHLTSSYSQIHNQAKWISRNPQSIFNQFSTNFTHTIFHACTPWKFRDILISILGVKIYHLTKLMGL